MVRVAREPQFRPVGQIIDGGQRAGAKRQMTGNTGNGRGQIGRGSPLTDRTNAERHALELNAAESPRYRESSLRVRQFFSRRFATTARDVRFSRDRQNFRSSRIATDFCAS